MNDAFLTRLDDRAVLRLEGADTRAFLQGLISNDVDDLAEGGALYAALLTPQGKFLFDLFLFDAGEAVLIDAEAARLDDLRTRLRLYRLRAKVAIEPCPERAVYAARDGRSIRDAADGSWLVAADPRHRDLGVRAIGPADAAGLDLDPPEAYDRHRLALGVPEASRDMVVGKSTLLEGNFEEMAGVAFDKGCYVGQELTARTKHRGLLKRRLHPVTIEGEAPPPGTPLLLHDDRGGEKEAGEMRTARGTDGIALLRLDLLEQAAREGYRSGAGTVRPRPLPWT
ncbi:MAG: folate-binding protein YgfZ [Geminicoccaceae bacterium]|nr:folate-binding protein YgfZ [Geminicoccaceae bacterium]